MRLLTTLVCLFLFTNLLICQEWKEIKQFVPNQSLHSIKFHDDMTGWTVSSLYNGSNFNIHKTEDGGDTWIDQSSGYTATRFKDIWIHSPEKVTMVGNFGLIIQTEDGGDNWTTIDSSLDHHLSGIFFVNEMLGFICGDAGTIIRTKDGGENWEKLNTGAIGVLNDVHFVDENTGFACGWNVMIKTEDGGDTWFEPEEFPIPTTNYQMQKIDFVSSTTGFVCGDIGQILKTEDGGNNWDFFVSGTEESLQSMEFISEDNGFACGFAGTILLTTDAGESWTAMNSPTEQILFDIEFPSFETGYICSWGGKILKLDNMISQIIEEASSIEISIYPNPSTDRIFIQTNEYIDPNKVEIQLFNQIGKRVFSQKPQLLSNGILELSLENVDSGIYFIQIRNNGNYNVQKIEIINKG